MFPLAALGLALAALALWRWHSFNHHETVTSKRGAAVQAVYATGEVEPVYWADVATQVPGRVIAVWAQDGQEVKKGDILAQLDDTVEASQLHEFIARLDYLEKERKRLEQLSKRDVASRRAYEQVVSDYNAVQAQITAQTHVIERMRVTAPLDGVILRRDVEPGEVVTLSDSIFWVGKLKPLRITAEVDEEDIPLVKTGQKALIKADAFADQPVEGMVGDITPKGDPVNKNFRVRIALPGHSPLMIGMTVEVNIITREEKNALLVPASSVIEDHVWIQDRHAIRKRKIKTGIRNDQYVQILDGLSGNETLILNPETLQRK